ncbi:MAG TPA: LysE family transporter [Rhizomicrobium sp.]|nr:LysE family transporter [Rhizomicrobium sp.]
MNYIALVISGIVMGLIAAAPIGPVNLICIRRTLAFGTLNGFMAGLGAAFGDGVFATVIGFGVTAVSKWIEGYSLYLQVVGGILLLAFGIHTYVTLPDPNLKEENKERAMEPSSLMRLTVSTFALTMTNPATMFGFAAMFTGLTGLANVQPTFIQAAIVVAAVFAGSALWWFALSEVIGHLHTKIDARVMRIINHSSGVAIAIFGLAVLGHLVVKYL